ncbi:MAG: TonB-dependent receptor [Agarilytica sp.]
MSNFGQTICKLMVFSTSFYSLCALSNTANIPPQADEEIIVIGENRSNFTIITENAQKLVDMPGALGDPISAVYALPGVVSDNESGEPSVRGSSPEDNLFMVDDLPSAYIFHTFSNSVFSEFIIQDFALYSAAFGPEYGDVTGAVFDVKLRDPEIEAFSTVLDFSLLRSGLFTEGAIGENSALYLSARKSFIHLLVPEQEEDGIRISQLPQDTDYQFKFLHYINDRQKLTFSANGATDKAEAEFTRESDIAQSNPDFEGDAKLTTAFNGQNLRYEILESERFSFLATAGNMVSTTDLDWGDDFFNKLEEHSQTFHSKSRISLHQKFDFYIGAQIKNSNYNMKFDQVLFTCTEFDPDCTLNRRERIQDTISADVTDTLAYIDNTVTPFDWLALNIGAQWHKNDYNNESFLHPRFSIDFQLGDKTTLSSKYGQYDRLPEIEFVLPELGNPDLASLQAKHYATGITQEIAQGWSVNLELYYKELTNIPLALDSEGLDGDQLYASDISGEAYGLDLLVNKERTDKWYSWLALSIGRSKRTNEQTSETKNYFLDTPMVFNWVLNYQVTNMFNVGWRWNIKSGKAYTPIVGTQENPYFEDSVLPVYGDPYSEQLPLYSRLDLRFKWEIPMGKTQGAVIVDIINALNQENTTSRTLDYDNVETIDDDVKTVDTVSPGIIPTIGFRYEF